ncbi:MAG: D-hexose-6-phosphate mutarotase [Chthoniobacterales bacterium]
MTHSNTDLDQWKHFEIPGKVAFSKDSDGLVKINIATPQSSAEVYLQGAHVTAFQQHGEDPMLFMSASGRMSRGTMLHGGIPICFPWFGNRPGEKLSHGFARLYPWDLITATVNAQEEVELLFQLPQTLLKESGWLPVETFYRVTIGEKLTLELNVNNTTQELFSYEECLHAYFLVGDIGETTIHGLKDLHYLDKTEDLISKLEHEDEIPITQETNRIYLNSTAPIEIHDRAQKRTIRIEKNFSHSTVVWNPWSEKAKTLPDFAPDDFKQMLCVESGNVGEFAKELPPGKVSVLQVQLSIVKKA